MSRRNPVGAPLRALLVTFLLGSGLLALGTVPAAGQAEPTDLPVATDGLDDIASCAVGTQRVLVELLIDQSGSLANTDPDADRVTASQAAAEGLAQAVDDSDGALEVDFSVAGFDGDYRPGSGWRRLERRTLVDVMDEIAEFEARNDGVDTDYVNALQGTTSSITEQAGTDDVCKVVLWFTDGHFDIADRVGSYAGRGKDEDGEWRTKAWAPDIRLDREGGGREAVERAESVLCDPGGVADQVRAAGITLVALPLTAQIRPDDVSTLGSIAVSPYAGESCGSLTTPRGAVLPAGSVDDLVRVFDQVAQKLAGAEDPTTSTTVVCSGEPGPACTETFSIDEALLRFHALVDTSMEGISVTIAAPEADATAVPATGEGRISSGAAELRYRWVTDSILLIDGTRPAGTDPPNWTGTWTLTFIDETGEHPDAVAESEVYLFGDLVPSLDEPSDDVYMGEATPLTLSIRHRDGTPEVDEDFVASLELSVTVDDGGPDGPIELPTPQPTGGSNEFTTTYEVPNPSSASRIEVEATLVVVTSSGIELAPTSSRSSLHVQPPRSYPEIVDKAVRIGPIVGADPGDDSNVGEIRVKGSPDGNGCAWISGVDFTVVPSEAGSLGSAVEDGHTSRDTCLVVAPEEVVTLRFSVDPEAQTRGIATGDVEVGLSADGNETPVTVTVPVEVALRRTIKIGPAIFLLVCLMAVGIGLPLLISVLLNWRNARFEGLASLSVAHIPVSITPAEVTRLDGQATLVSFFDFTPLQERGRPRSFVIPAPIAVSPPAGDVDPFGDGGSSPAGGAAAHRLDAVGWRNPFSAPFGKATGPSAVLGSEPQRFHDDGGRIPLGLGNAWFFAVDPDDIARPGRAHDELRGTLVCFGESADLARTVYVLNDAVAPDLTTGCDHLLARLGLEAPPVEEGEDEVDWEHDPGGGTGGPVPPGPDVWGDANQTIVAPPPDNLPPTPPPAEPGRRAKKRSRRAKGGGTDPDPWPTGGSGGDAAGSSDGLWDEKF